MHVGLRWSRICVGLKPLARFQGLRIKTHGQVGLAHVFLRGLFFWLSLQAQLTDHSRIRRRSNRRPTEATDP